jgi:hypothetical protein
VLCTAEVCVVRWVHVQQAVLTWRQAWRELACMYVRGGLTGGAAGLVRGAGAGTATGAVRTVRAMGAMVVLSGGVLPGASVGLRAGLMMGGAGLLTGGLVAGRFAGVAAGGAAVLTVALLAGPEISSSFCSSSAWYCLRSSICDEKKEVRTSVVPVSATHTGNFIIATLNCRIGCCMAS